MKNILFSILCISSLSLATAAQADSKLIYSNDNGVVTRVVKGTIQFPEYGEVAADRVCVTADLLTLKVTITGGMQRICVQSYVDTSDSTHPETKCRKYETIQQPTRNLETPVTTMKSGCVRSHVDDQDSTHPVVVCDQIGMVSVSQSLAYKVEHYDSQDYRHFNNPKVENKTISICQ